MKAIIKKLIIAVIAAAAITAACRFGALYGLDNTLSDALYQRPAASVGDILVIGIDQQSLSDLGRFQDWDRSVLAEALEMLNADPDLRPLAIGVDVLFIGESSPEADAYLTEAAARYGNVVTASAAEFGSGVTETPDGFAYWDDFLITGFDAPFNALRAVTRVSHINAMLDGDGILRSSLLYIDPPEGRIWSFNYRLYELYTEYYGLPQNTPRTDPRGFWYVPFTGGPGEYYEGFGVSDLLSGELDPGLWADRIVLIGPYAAGMQDSYPTAIMRSENMYGVEFQANCIEALIRGDFCVYASDSRQALILFVIVFLCVFWFPDRKVPHITAAWLIICAVWLGLCIALRGAGLLLHPLWIPLAVTAVYVAAVAVNYSRAAMEKRRVTNTFKRYVAPEIVNELLKQDADALTAGKMVHIAVLFVDIRGFTPMSELLEPSQVVEILNRYLTLTSSCIMNNKGTLDKFIGDATMAFWGAPVPQEDYIYNAVKTAADMVKGAKAVGDELLERYGRTVSFGIGVHCGPAVVGNIGAPNRMDYTAIGDTVNTAARLESNAPAGQVYISRAVADALGDRIQVTSLGDTIKLKGKTEGFEVLRLDTLTDDK